MRFYSTSGVAPEVSFREAVLQGLAPDGGLYLPKTLPHFSLDQIKKVRGLSFLELSIELGTVLFKDILTPDEVAQTCEEAFTFPATFLNFPHHLHLLELFHGPSLSFKDFGTQFMAALLRRWRNRDKEMIVLVATSGDTGSAVGMAFHNMPGVRVYILFPKGRVTPSQKQQLTTIGNNVKALEIDGSFEQCQNLVREALLDEELRKVESVTVANSINVARLFPQALYYFYAYCQLEPPFGEVVFSVPSGNFGHLVSGILAKKMGLPVFRFLAVTNINDEVPLFLKSGIFEPHEAYPSLAVSMDVGNPSNFPRLLSLYGGSLELLKKDLLGFSISDEQIKESVREMFQQYGYLMDPHTATAYLALNNYVKTEKQERPGIFFATAHPAKFLESLNSFISAPIHVPERLEAVMEKPQRYTTLPPDYQSFKEQFFVNI